MIRVILPHHLRTLTGVGKEVSLQVADPVTLEKVLSTLEEVYPVLRGTIRDATTGQRRSLIRFFACSQDFSAEPLDVMLPDAVANGSEPLIIVGAMAGG